MENKTDEKAPVSFDLALKEVDVTIGGEPYKIMELTGSQRDSFLTKSAKRITTVGKGDNAEQRITNFNGLQSELVVLALRKVGPSGSLEAVQESTIQQWPAPVVSELHKMARELSALGADEDDEGGND